MRSPRSAILSPRAHLCSVVSLVSCEGCPLVERLGCPGRLAPHVWCATPWIHVLPREGVVSRFRRWLRRVLCDRDEHGSVGLLVELLLEVFVRDLERALYTKAETPGVVT